MIANEMLLNGIRSISEYFVDGKKVVIIGETHYYSDIPPPNIVDVINLYRKPDTVLLLESRLSVPVTFNMNIAYKMFKNYINIDNRELVLPEIDLNFLYHNDPKSYKFCYDTLKKIQILYPIIRKDINGGNYDAKLKNYVNIYIDYHNNIINNAITYILEKWLNEVVKKDPKCKFDKTICPFEEYLKTKCCQYIIDLTRGELLGVMDLNIFIEIKLNPANNFLIILGDAHADHISDFVLKNYLIDSYQAVKIYNNPNNVFEAKLKRPCKTIRCKIIKKRSAKKI